MADNNRISIKKTSRVLAITCVAYTTVATILYNNYQIDLIDYSTPVILGTVATIISCAALQRLFCSLLAKNYLSFGCKVSPKAEAVVIGINTDKPDELSQTVNATSTVSVVEQRPSYLEKYDARMEELERVKKEKRAAIVSTIHDYTTSLVSTKKS